MHTETPARKISYSAVSQYFSCPMRYRFRYVEDLPAPGPESPARLLGIAIHQALRDFYADYPHVPSLAEWQAQVSSELHGALANFYRRAEQEGFQRPAYLEVPFEVSIGSGVVLQGRIDRIDYEPETESYRVLDYKTGMGNLPTEPELFNDLQLSVYALGARQITGVFPRALGIYSLYHDQLVWTHRTDAQLDALREKIAQFLTSVEAGDFKAKPSEEKCRQCDYRPLCPEFRSEYLPESVKGSMDEVIEGYLTLVDRKKTLEAQVKLLEEEIKDHYYPLLLAFAEEHSVTRFNHHAGHIRINERVSVQYDLERVVPLLEQQGVLPQVVKQLDSKRMDEILETLCDPQVARTIHDCTTAKITRYPQFYPNKSKRPSEKGT